jgi:hypothetical protein
LAGTISVSRAWSTMKVAVAVMPGRSAPSGLATAMTASYDTTLAVVRAWLRTCRTTPPKLRSGNASKRSSTVWPSRTWPTSASATLACSSMRARSPAITNSSGACSDAATVLPGSTERDTTTPAIGAVIVA